jgi:hypothetical protein
MQFIVVQRLETAEHRCPTEDQIAGETDAPACLLWIGSGGDLYSKEPPADRHSRANDNNAANPNDGR